MTTPEQNFESELKKLCAQAALLGADNTRLLRAVEQYGAVKAVKEYFRKNRPTDGFALLAEKKRLDLSAEALAVTNRYGVLFTDDEVNACFEALVGAGYFSR